MHCFEKKVLLTGATGLIGKELAAPLLAHGFEVYAITIDKSNCENGFHWIQGSVFDEQFLVSTIEQVQPSHLLNMAWVTTGDYLTSPINYSFLTAGVNLARLFATHGGKRAVYAGTCFEYRFQQAPLKEDSPLDPDRNEYTFCKNHLREIAARIFAKEGVSFGYGRIFNAFGRGEHPSRFTGMVVDRLRKGEQVIIKGGPLVKDYVYSKDIANAFVALLDSTVDGPINVATGSPITIRDFALTIGRVMGRENRLTFIDDCANQPPRVTADVKRLIEEVGYRPQYSIERACKEICDWKV